MSEPVTMSGHRLAFWERQWRRPDGRGLHIAFEGPEGCGKTTQAKLLASRIGAVATREPGGTAVGAAIRRIVVDGAEEICARTEALLMAADRAQHHAEIVEPALSCGVPVVSDRGFYSTLAYQHYGRGLDAAELAGISEFAAGGPGRHLPDVVVMLVVDPAEAHRRRSARATVDRFENERFEFHRRVFNGFVEMAGRDRYKWVLVDGVGDPDEVEQRVFDAVAAHPIVRTQVMPVRLASNGRRPGFVTAETYLA